MGLFDSLQFSGGGQGGLLDMLRAYQLQQQGGGFNPIPAGPDVNMADLSARMGFPQVPVMPQQNAAPPQQPVAPQQQQAQPIAVGDYMMPRAGAASLYEPQQSALPPNAQPTQGQMPQQPEQLPPALGGGQQPNGFIRGLQSIGNGGGLISALTGNYNDPQSVQRQNLKAQYDALVPMLGPQKAMLAVMNPEAGKTLLGEALTNKEKWQKTGVDALGNEQFGFVNEREQTINGKPAGAAAANPDGIGAIDHNLKGDAYLKQFPPEVQSQVRDYIAGKTVPTGNPRRNNIVKQIASKYGEDTGVAVDDATFAARKQMRTQLSSSAPSSLGGQINIGNTAAGHLADLAEQALKLGNVDTGIAPLSHAVNSVRGLGTEQAAKMEALKGAAQHYGQEITKFYAGSPGGVAERDRFIESVGAAKSPKELAAIIETEAQLMQSRLNTLGDQIKGVLGPMASDYPVIRPDSVKAFQKIEETVGKLKGGSSTRGAAPDRSAVEAEMRRRGLMK